MYNVIVNMYNDIKSRVEHNNEYSEFFPCQTGVRQGENLYHLLFSIYVNDIVDYLSNKNINGVEIDLNGTENDFRTYAKLFILLYADDTVLLSESIEDLQNQLNHFSEYSKRWKLKVNVSKTKVMTFCNGRLRQNQKLLFNDEELEFVTEFNYLGLLHSRTGSFNKAKKKLAEKATKAMYSVLKKGRSLNLSIKCQIELFDKIVKPVLLYGCEIWGYGKNDIIEQIHLKFLKHLLHMKKSTPNSIVYGETGRYPIEINIKTRMITYWCGLLESRQKISSALYSIAHSKFVNNNYDIPWIKSIRNIFNECGLPYMFQLRNIPFKNWVKSNIKQKLIDQFIQTWNDDIQTSPKCLNYRIFKTDICFEEYFNILNIRDLITLCKFRTLNHSLPIEKGRWHNIEREERKCTICDMSVVGDEYHYIMECPSLENQTKNYIPQHIYRRHNTLKFHSLFNTNRIS